MEQRNDSINAYLATNCSIEAVNCTMHFQIFEERKHIMLRTIEREFRYFFLWSDWISADHTMSNRFCQEN